MVENCSHNCEGCTENCSERTKESFLEKPNEMSHIKKVIGVVSGKGGVGKSLVTSLLAVLSRRKGYKTAIMDAPISQVLPSPGLLACTATPKQANGACFR